MIFFKKDRYGKTKIYSTVQSKYMQLWLDGNQPSKANVAVDDPVSKNLTMKKESM